mmetsp:Transcript_16392/g.28365  ORF Transcript_16392/g.28365 Transcript_16392/m.28365 type:complete len:201 (+) Transcript_16392:405-1007(+)
MVVAFVSVVAIAAAVPIEAVSVVLALREAASAESTAALARLRKQSLHLDAVDLALGVHLFQSVRSGRRFGELGKRGAFGITTRIFDNLAVVEVWIGPQLLYQLGLRRPLGNDEKQPGSRRNVFRIGRLRCRPSGVGRSARLRNKDLQRRKIFQYLFPVHAFNCQSGGRGFVILDVANAFGLSGAFFSNNLTILYSAELSK